MRGFSEERLAPVNGIEIAYQELGDPSGEPLLLIMGLATQMLAWDEELCAMLGERGFRVVRLDNRDIGRSTKIDWAGVPGRADMLLGRRRTAPYLLSDMAADTTGLMDHLGVESAHLVGASMGGMIAQTVAIDDPRRVRSLVSMMSSTGNRRHGVPTWKAFGTLFARPGVGREAAIEQTVRTFKIIGSPAYPMDEAAPAGHRPARRQRPPDPPRRRPRHRLGDPRLPPARLRGHGSRPAPGPLARFGRGDRGHRDPRRRPGTHRFGPMNSSSLATSSLRET